MACKEIDFSNESEIVALIIDFSNSNSIAIKTNLKAARVCMLDWKKFCQYWMSKEEDRLLMEKPFALYHFLDPENIPQNSFLFANVMSMRIVPIHEDPSESWRGGH